jgi:WD40 repeat protein
MDFERVDSFPEFNLFFSPNWYSHQIADISPSGLCALGCNDEVQLIDLHSRRPITSLYIKTPNTDKYLNDINERKVTAVLMTDNYIVFATMAGYLSIFEISNNNIVCKFSDCVLQNVQISCIKQLKPENCELELFLTDNKSKIIFAKFKAGVLDQLNLERQGNNHSTKNIEIIDYKEEQFYAKIMDNGTFNIWTAYFEDAVYNVDIGHIVNTASFGIFDGLLIISMISRKNRILICQVGLEKILDDFLKERKFVYTNGNNFRLLVNIELEVQTPFLPQKSQQDIKLRFHNRIISFNDQRIVITSKDGNMYLTDIESLMKVKEDKLIIKPAAYEDNENPFYEMFDENPHFKNIYFSKMINDTYVAIGMDRLVSFWKVNRYKVQYDFNIKCLGSKVAKIATSILEPQTFLLACNDKTMRLWNTGKKANRFVTTILWKGLDKRQVREMTFHPKDDSIVCLLGDREISIMDIHAHTIISEFYVNDIQDGDVTFSRWLRREVVEKFIDNRFENEIMKIIKNNKGYKGFISEKTNSKVSSKFAVVNNKYVKEIDKGHLYVTYIQNKGFLVADFRLGTMFCVNYKLERFISSVEVIDLLEERKLLLFILGDKKGNVIIVRFKDDRFDHLFIDGVHSALISDIKVNTLRLAKGKPDQEEPPKAKDKDVKPVPLKKLLFFTNQDSETPEKPAEGDSSQLKSKNFKNLVIDADDIVFATGSLDRTIRVHRLRGIFKNTKLSYDNIAPVCTFKHKYRISSIDWDPFDPDRLLNVAQKHVTVQVWTINPKKELERQENAPEETQSKEVEGEDDPYCIANIRGHKGFITSALWSRYDKDCIITSSDDQSVKIWNLANIRFKKQPGKKKNNNKLGEVIVEQNEEDEDEYQEKQPSQKNRTEDYYSSNKFDKFKQVGKKDQERIDDDDDD